MAKSGAGELAKANRRPNKKRQEMPLRKRPKSVKIFFMLKIRLARTGKKHHPSYRFVVIDSRKKRDGRYLEKLGSYNASVEPPSVKIDQKRLAFWQSQGARVTAPVRKILEKTSWKNS
jgi:small subunit ribosomal protein S16